MIFSTIYVDFDYPIFLIYVDFVFIICRICRYLHIKITDIFYI
nr:MAG TPA: hypothetical protein [Bacteriophage sp.]